MQEKLKPIAGRLLEWYHANRRILPFREDPQPYNIWVSEIMLQQTRVAAALEYYARFTAELPNAAALAACEPERLNKLWQGLGYYSRVRNMQKAAQMVVEQHGGELPGDYEQLRALPGIGDYTAGAIASIAFGLPEVAVDGNVLRVFSRLLNSDADITLPATKKALAAEVKAQQPPEEAGDYNQALMELGALVCTPGKPDCAACPLGALCHGYKAGTAAMLPVKPPKKEKLESRVCILIVHSDARVLVQQRPSKGLLAGLWQPLLWEDAPDGEQAAARLAGLLPDASLTAPLPAAKHIFTHRVWRMYGWRAVVPGSPAAPDGYVWATPEQLQGLYSVPSAFRSYLPIMLKQDF